MHLEDIYHAESLICGIGEELVVELGFYFILSRRDLQNVKSKVQSGALGKYKPPPSYPVK
jgi:hypothetical protein